MSRAVISPASTPLVGTPSLPGDKSVSHRRALMSLLISGSVVLKNFNNGSDGWTTLRCLERLGKKIITHDNQITIEGDAGCPSSELDCGNSGTTARLLMGILSAQPGEWRIRGDASLSRRPMERVAVPLRMMGADIETTDGSLPVRMRGRSLHGIEYDSPVTSAQVKSAVLLAALQAKGSTRYREAIPTRDHTERILELAPDDQGWINLDPHAIRLNADRLSAVIPGDPSAAAFWTAAALMVPDSKLRIERVLADPIRTAFVDVVKKSGGQVGLDTLRQESNELVGDAFAEYSVLRPMMTKGNISAQLIDEFPALAVLAAKINGTSIFSDVGELRVKESDRLQLVADGLNRMGALAVAEKDSIEITGPADQLRGAPIETNGDHRLVMAFAVAGLAAIGETILTDPESAMISDSGFWSEFSRLAPGCLRFEK